MLVCYAIGNGNIPFGDAIYKLYDKDTRQFYSYGTNELINALNSGVIISNLGIDSSNKIVGKGISIRRLSNYDGIGIYTVISELTNEKGDIVGYEVVTSDSRVVQVSKKDITSAAQYGRVTNMIYVADRQYARLISRDGIDTKIKSIDYRNMDTNWDITVSTARKIFEAYGFKPGYVTKYKYANNYDTEAKYMYLNIMYDANGNILYFNEEDKADSKLCYYGGHLITETLGEGKGIWCGSFGSEESIYTKDKFTYNTFDIRENFVRAYTSVIEGQNPVPFMLDSQGRLVYELDLATKAMKVEREKLTTKLDKDDELLGFGLENIVFIYNQYNNFNQDLQRIMKLYYDNATDLIARLAVSDIMNFQSGKLDKKKTKSMITLLNTYCGKYGIHEDWQKLLKNTIAKIQAENNEKQKQFREEHNKRLSDQSKGTGLFGMFSRK